MLVFPDVEKITRQWLLPHLQKRFGEQVRVGTEAPSGTQWKQSQPWLVLLTTAGTGARRSLVFEQVLIGFHCYAPSKSQAQEVCAYTRALLEEWPRHANVVTGFSDNSRPSDAFDEDVGYPAYYGSAQLLFKATTAQL